MMGVTNNWTHKYFLNFGDGFFLPVCTTVPRSRLVLPPNIQYRGDLRFLYYRYYRYYGWRPASQTGGGDIAGCRRSRSWGRSMRRARSGPGRLWKRHRGESLVFVISNISPSRSPSTQITGSGTKVVFHPTYRSGRQGLTLGVFRCQPKTWLCKP